MAGIYIHIPFCKQACHYCDFHFSTNLGIRSDLIQSILKEISLQANYLEGESIKTIYFGGGTPSLLEEQDLNSILDLIRATHRLSDSAEITMEANPDDLSPSKVKELRRMGINRLSIGIQSFHPELLTFLNRVHTSATAISSFHHARDAGFQNISIDLIYAIPGESTDQWMQDIRQAIALQPDHLSCYGLTIEEKTVLGRWSAAGKLKLVEDEIAAQQLEILMDELEPAGFEHYEISNFAKPGLHSKHNSSYWKQEHYLGIGPSAHSFNGESRQYNISNNHLYVKSIQSGKIPFEKEILSRENKINEYILTTLRTSWGTDLKNLKRVYSYDLVTANDAYISQLLNNQLVVLDEEVLRLTRKGKLIADKISSDLFVLQS